MERGGEGGNADWMSRVPVELRDVPLCDLAIPGSHDSMTYCLDVHSPVLGSVPCFLRLLDALFPSCTRTCVSRWATTQAVSLSDQCDAGVRFFDLRIANKLHSKTEDSIYFSHTIYTLLSVKEALSDLSVWLESHPQELVILACSHFYQLSRDDHMQLVCFLTQLFSTRLCPPQDTPSLALCWSRGQQVILSYDDEDMQHQHTQLWPKIPYSYANSSSAEDIISYLEKEKTKGRPAGFFASGLNLTEHAPFVLSHPCMTMRKMTLDSLAVLLGWVQGQEPGPVPSGLNIICCDFVGASEFCSLVIGLNSKLLALDQR